VTDGVSAAEDHMEPAALELVLNPGVGKPETVQLLVAYDPVLAERELRNCANWSRLPVTIAGNLDQFGGYGGALGRVHGDVSRWGG
jgi:hypothetical protein